MRLFLSITLNDELRGDLAAVVDELRRRASEGRFTLPENLHLPQYSQGGLIGVSAKQQVNSFELMQSERISDRLTYTTLYTRHAME